MQSDSRFAPAEVAVTLGNAHPSFVPVLLAKLHQVISCLHHVCFESERASKGGIIGLHDLSLTTAPITRLASHWSLKKIEGVAASNNAVTVQACPLTVPKVILKLKSESADAYFQRWAYRRAEQWSKKTKAMVEGWEEQEVYLRRVTAHVQFYAAFLQSDNQKQLGIDHAWAYMSR